MFLSLDGLALGQQTRLVGIISVRKMRENSLKQSRAMDYPGHVLKSVCLTLGTMTSRESPMYIL